MVSVVIAISASRRSVRRSAPLFTRLSAFCRYCAILRAMQANKIFIRRYLGVLPSIYALGGIVFVEGWRLWRAGDSRYWYAILIVVACVAVGVLLSRRILRAIP
jgi:hypothetical protein